MTLNHLILHEPLIRLLTFGAVLALMAVWEFLAPRRPTSHSRGVRWANNLGLLAVDVLAVRLVFPLAAVGFALLLEERGLGLFNQVGVAWPAAVLVSVIALDLTVYLQHRLFHAVPALWRLHRVHHVDPDFDVTTGVRFHPLEILISLAIKLAIIALLGAPAVAVLIFELLLNAISMFNHGNIRLPRPLDRVLRYLVVTPDMHRVHHSVWRQETDANFGFNLPWWDRLFGTYRDQPRDGHQGMTIGTGEFRDPGELLLPRLLTQPFRRSSHQDPRQGR